tara:strand:- start:301 stop:444 length:144 start_codon:yes stop_codon:yes gene_type:complete
MEYRPSFLDQRGTLSLLTPLAVQVIQVRFVDFLTTIYKNIDNKIYVN